MSKKRSRSERRAPTAAEWNEKYPVGTPVRYHPVMGDPEFVTSKTRSPAWQLGHGQSVVAIEGQAGGVCLEAVEAIEQTQPIAG